MSERPRLTKKEQELWNEFVPIAKGKYGNFQYDIQVKPTRETLNTTEKEYLKNWDSLTSPRIDVYGTTIEGKPVIFEIREKADFSTIASIIAYSELMKTTGQLQADAELIIVCRKITNNTFQLANMKGIRVVVLKEYAERNQI